MDVADFAFRLVKNEVRPRSTRDPKNREISSQNRRDSECVNIWPTYKWVLRNRAHICFADMFQMTNSHDTSAAQVFFNTMKSVHALAIASDRFHLRARRMRRPWERRVRDRNASR